MTKQNNIKQQRLFTADQIQASQAIATSQNSGIATSRGCNLAAPTTTSLFTNSATLEPRNSATPHLKMFRAEHFDGSARLKVSIKRQKGIRRFDHPLRSDPGEANAEQELGDHSSLLVEIRPSAEAPLQGPWPTSTPPTTPSPAEPSWRPFWGLDRLRETHRLYRPSVYREARTLSPLHGWVPR